MSLKGLVNLPGVGSPGEVFVTPGGDDGEVLVVHKEGKVVLYDVLEKDILHTWYTNTGEKVVTAQAAGGEHEKAAAVVVVDSGQVVFATRADSKLDSMDKLNIGSDVHDVLVHDKELYVVFRNGNARTLNFLRKNAGWRNSDAVLGPAEQLAGSWIVQHSGLTRIVHQVENSDDGGSVVLLTGDVLLDPDNGSVKIVNIVRSVLMARDDLVTLDVSRHGSPTLAVLNKDGCVYARQLFKKVAGGTGDEDQLRKVCAVSGIGHAGLTCLDDDHAAVMNSEDEGGVLEVVNLRYGVVASDKKIKATVHEGRGIGWIGPNLYLNIGGRVASVRVEGLDGGLESLLGRLATNDVTTCYNSVPAMIEKRDAAGLVNLLNTVEDLPESLHLDCVRFFLRDEADREERLLHLAGLFSRRFSDVIMSEEVRRVPVEEVVTLLSHLDSLLVSPASPTISPAADQCLLLDWVSLVLNSHYLQLVVTTDQETLDVLTRLAANVADSQDSGRLLVEARQVVYNIINTRVVPDMQASNSQYCIEIIQI